LALLFVYARLTDILDFGAMAGPRFVHLAPQEISFWLAHVGVAVPGLWLLAYGQAPRFAPRLARLWRRLSALSPRGQHVATLAYCAALFVMAVLGRWLILRGLPVTDDENAVRFGARMLAAGRLSVPDLEPDGAFTTLFTFHRDGRVMSMDFPGALLLAAASLASGLGSLLYAALAALTAGALVYAAHRLGGWRTALVCGLVWAFSPMVATLSMTTHAHVASRAFLALALAAYAGIVTGGSTRCGLALGLASGAMFLCRPVEAALLLLPVAFHLLRRYRRALASALVGLSVPLCVFAWWNLQTTGVWYLQARFAPGVTEHPLVSYTPWIRIASNLGFNVLMLAFFFLGPLGFLLAAAGLRKEQPATLVLLGGVGLILLLALLHDNTGIHIIGPIHYSECAVPLTLLGALGIVRLADLLTAHALPVATPALLLCAYLVFGMSLFQLTHAASLRAQADNQAAPFDAVRAAGLHKAVVVGDAPGLLYETRKELSSTRSWVLAFPHPDPFFRDDVIYAYPTDVPALRLRFPDRAFFRMRYPKTGPLITLEPISEPSP
jgi:hypothetical protein